ncbi:MAG: HAMP domain-containing histidine kinase [Oculatellaceae cyanobacterium Prado106]|nr:HAMP domain-containing histidine kinase [Oculatellaceae cyanobacterium Prado106]
MSSEPGYADQQSSKKSTLTGWRKGLASVRTRLLLWYFVLTACTALISVKASQSIYCDRLKERAEAHMIQQADQFENLLEKVNEKVPRPATLEGAFDKFWNTYASTRDEYVITLVNGQIYDPKSVAPQEILSRNPELLATWTQLNLPKKARFQGRNEQLSYIAQPVKWGGDRGMFIVLYDPTEDLRVGQDALINVMQVTFAFLLISAILAWITSGRVLYPLRLLTKTAHSITASDMTQRIPVEGTDEIAELTDTFNEMLDRLQIVFDSQKEFLKDASHELRTPITVIQGHLEMLNYLPPQQQDESIQLVMDELERMSRLVNDLLLLAKTERPDFLKLKTEELDWLTEELYLKSRSLAPRDWKLASKGLCPVTVDRQRLTQAMMNLVQNAVRHTQDGDTITLGSTVKDNHAYLWVQDTGEGIAAEDQARIFQRFARATRHDPQFEGHGLGLAIAQAIAKSHGGWIELSSHLGQGSTFTLVFPLTPDLTLTSHESDSHRRRQSSHYRLPGNRTASSRIHDHSR